MKSKLIFDYKIKKADKNRLNCHKSIVVWFLGLSGSGKSTYANFLEEDLFKNKIRTSVLDGDQLRSGLNSDLGFSFEDRMENIRRVTELSKIMTENGLVTICSFISPLEKQRELVKSIIGKENIYWIYVNTPLKVCISRDPKGLYKKAIKGEIKEFTGISQIFEVPKIIDFEVDYKDDISDNRKSILNEVLKKITK